MPRSELRKLRKRMGLALREVARQTGLSTSIISDLETGKKHRDLTRYAGKLAQVLGDEVHGMVIGGRQVRLALEGLWDNAERRPELDEKAKKLLREMAGRKEKISADLQVWQLPNGSWIFAPAGLEPKQF